MPTGKQLTIDGGESKRGPSEKTSVYLPPDLREQAEHRAGLEGRSLSNFVAWCISQKLANP